MMFRDQNLPKGTLLWKKWPQLCHPALQLLESQSWSNSCPRTEDFSETEGAYCKRHSKSLLLIYSFLLWVLLQVGHKIASAASTLVSPRKTFQERPPCQFRWENLTRNVGIACNWHLLARVRCKPACIAYDVLDWSVNNRAAVKQSAIDRDAEHTEIDVYEH